MSFPQVQATLGSGDLSFQISNKHGVFIDALSYVDESAGTQEARAIANKLILAEMKNSKSEGNPLESFQLPEFQFKSEILKNEWQRVTASESMAQLDASRYEAPPAKKDTEASWRQAVSNAKTQLEHQRENISNLELMSAYGPHAWKMFNAISEEGIASSKVYLDAQVAKVEEINRNRFESQTEAAKKLRNLEQQYLLLAAKNLQIEAACLKLEKQLPSQ